jgi:hypothetical protein
MKKYLMRAGVIVVLGLSHLPAYAATTPRQIPGYACMMLNLTEQQSMDPSVHIPVRSAPSESAPPIGWAGAVVAVREPVAAVNGFVAMLFPTGQQVWISKNDLRPYHSLGDPGARCVPVMLPNGRVGFDSPR